MARARFRQADLTRAVRAAEKAGLCVAGYEIGPDCISIRGYQPRWRHLCGVGG